MKRSFCFLIMVSFVLLISSCSRQAATTMEDTVGNVFLVSNGIRHEPYSRLTHQDGIFNYSHLFSATIMTRTLEEIAPELDTILWLYNSQLIIDGAFAATKRSYLLFDKNFQFIRQEHFTENTFRPNIPNDNEIYFLDIHVSWQNGYDHFYKSYVFKIQP